ncbi:MAG: DUF86 domain-containing protein [Limnochordia bacterium]|jgi:uncharacterized protein YutE (UPF0331/DUF86 family)|nr:DUF86 domain-containing protein [Limnochordia bacterium]
MGDIMVICNRLRVLLDYYKEFQESAQGLTLETYKSHRGQRRIMERLTQLIVECSTDVNNMILKYLHKAPATDYFNSFLDLADSGVIDLDFALTIAPSTGLRNILVHEYAKIDDTIVYHSIKSTLEQYGRYLRDIATYLNCEME